MTKLLWIRRFHYSLISHRKWSLLLMEYFIVVLFDFIKVITSLRVSFICVCLWYRLCFLVRIHTSMSIGHDIIILIYLSSMYSLWCVKTFPHACWWFWHTGTTNCIIWVYPFEYFLLDNSSDYWSCGIVCFIRWSLCLISTK